MGGGKRTWSFMVYDGNSFVLCHNSFVAEIQKLWKFGIDMPVGCRYITILLLSFPPFSFFLALLVCSGVFLCFGEPTSAKTV